MSFIVCVSSFVVLMTLYYRSMVVWKTSCHWLIYIQITNRVVIVFTNGFGWNRKCIKGVKTMKIMYCNLKIKLNTDQCLSDKIWGNYYTKHSVLQSWKKKIFCLTLGQTGTGVLSYPWALCLSHHFFVILYITCHFFFFFFYTELNARLPIVMIIKQLN